MPKYEVEVTRIRTITCTQTFDIKSETKLTEDEAHKQALALARKDSDGDDWEEADICDDYECEVTAGQLKEEE